MTNITEHIGHLERADAHRADTGRISQYLADSVVAALIEEATLSPKPGLVDMRSQGAHDDLNWDLMCDSACALHGTFYAMAEAAQEITDLQVLRERIGDIGRQGEAHMMVATAGVNTHRGAIWALGLLVSAAAQNSMDLAPQLVAQRAAKLARLHDDFAPTLTGNKGETACRVYRVGGAKQQAQAGFPHVLQIALPALSRWRERGVNENVARLHALLSIMATLDDTCVLSRGGTEALYAVQSGARRVLQVGGMATTAGRAALRRYEKNLLDLHVSPGGAADLLAAALFLDSIKLGFPH